MSRTKQTAAKSDALVAKKRRTMFASNGKGNEPQERPLKKFRFKHGTVALRKVRKEQRRTDMALRTLPFVRLVRKVALEVASNKTRLSKTALSTLQHSTEAFLVKQLRKAQYVACEIGNHQTLTSKDILAVQEVNDSDLSSKTRVDYFAHMS